MLRNKAATICQTVGEKTTLTEKPNRWTGHGFVGTTTGMKTNPVRSFLICVFFLLGDFFLLWWPRAWDSFCECFAGVVAFSSVVINDKKKVLFFLVSCLFGCLRHGQGHHDVDRIKKTEKIRRGKKKAWSGPGAVGRKMSRWRRRWPFAGGSRVCVGLPLAFYCWP